MRSYSVKEIFYTLQGEGANTGRAAVFCRFAGCNLWSGHEEDRAEAVCRFCDTDFVGTDGLNGGRFSSATGLAKKIAETWTAKEVERKFVVCTGGEPMLQMDADLIDALHQEGFEIAIETNGTRAVPPGLDWICVSPKAGAECVIQSGDELKLIYPQTGADPRDFEHFEFQHFYLQPMDGPDRERNTKLTLEFCMEHPRWKLSLQTHKLIGIP